MKPENIFIVRHGESEGNVDKTIYEHKPDYAITLTSTGKNQAYLAGRKIANICGDHSTAFYVSPFWRTRQTAEQIKKNFHNDRIWNSYEDVRLREQEWGGHMNKGFNDEHERLRDEYGTFYWRFPNGESCADVFDRVSDFFNTLYRDFEKFNYPKNTVIVAHGMTMRVFLMRWFHMTVEEFELMANPKNGEFFHLQKQSDGKYKLLTEPTKYDNVLHPYQYVAQ